MNKRGKILLASALGITALAGAYLGGRQYYGGHFLPGTTINQVECGNLTEQEAIDKLIGNLEAYQLTIHDSVTDMTLSAAEAGLSFKNPQEVTALLQQQDKDLWFTELSKDEDFETDYVAFDENVLKDSLSKLACMHPATEVESKSARIKYNKDSKQYEIIEESFGNIISESRFLAGAKEAVLSGQEELDLTSNLYYKQPKYRADGKTITRTKDRLDQYMSASVHYKHGDFEYSVDGDVIHKFLKVKKDFKVVFLKQKMIDFLVENISGTFNTIGTTRSFHSPGSGDITIGGGAYGWRVDVKAERLKLKKEIKAGKTVSRKPIYMQKAKSRTKGNDIGDSYVDVSIANQRLWVIRDGEIVFSSDFVSGNPNLGRQTDKGVHFVEYKRTNYDMSNYNVWVKYWLPFNTAEGEGFHDATWRSTFGGSYYLRDGSHGCINLPLYAAQTLYNMLPCGYPVIVH